jgi:citrate synthase
MTKLVKHNEKEILFGKENFLSSCQNKSFAQMIFELLSGKEPTTEQLKIFELILNLSIDHGPDTPSAVKTIESAKNGETISNSVAEGIKQINNIHGGAIEPAMELFYKINSEKLGIKEIVEDYLKNEKRLPGFGHRIYKEKDPRAELIIEKLTNQNLSSNYIKIAIEIEKEIELQKGRKLPLNIDGVIAIALCSFGWETKIGKAVFIIARVSGLCGHFLDETI